MHRDGMQIDEQDLPGVGIRNDFLTARNRRVGVITRRDGRRDLLIYKKHDPDSVSETVCLTEGEADVLAEYLGTRRVIHRLSHITDQIDGLESGKVSIPQDRRISRRDLAEQTGRGFPSSRLRPSRRRRPSGYWHRRSNRSRT